MRLSEFFRNAGTKQIVINSDIDGFLSGMILQEYYGCEIVGFSNSKESIWLKPGIDIRSPIYIDIFVRDPKVYCIDQHIVAYDRPHLERISAYGTKLNPNLDLNKRTFLGDLGNDADYYSFQNSDYYSTFSSSSSYDSDYDSDWSSDWDSSWDSSDDYDYDFSDWDSDFSDWDSDW